MLCAVVYKHCVNVVCQVMLNLMIASIAVVIFLVNFGIQADSTNASGAQYTFFVNFIIIGDMFQCIVPNALTDSVQLSTLYTFNVHFARWLLTADYKNVKGFGQNVRLQSCTKGTNDVDHLCEIQIRKFTFNEARRINVNLFSETRAGSY